MWPKKPQNNQTKQGKNSKNHNQNKPHNNKPSISTEKTAKNPSGLRFQAKILIPFKLLEQKIYKDQDIRGIDCNGCQNKRC